MAKELFLKVYIPEGQRHCVLDETNFKKIRPGYLLFADKCLTPIKDEHAEALLRQNPHVIAEKPMSKSAIEKAQENMPRPAYTPDHVSKKILVHDEEVDAETSLEIDSSKKKSTSKTFIIEKSDVEINTDVKLALEALAKMSDDEYAKLPPKDVREYALTLGLKIPVTVKKEEALKVLNGRAAELMEQVKSAEEDYDAEN